MLTEEKTPCTALGRIIVRIGGGKGRVVPGRHRTLERRADLEVSKRFVGRLTGFLVRYTRLIFTEFYLKGTTTTATASKSAYAGKTIITKNKLKTVFIHCPSKTQMVSVENYGWLYIYVYLHFFDVVSRRRIDGGRVLFRLCLTYRACNAAVGKTDYIDRGFA